MKINRSVIFLILLWCCYFLFVYAIRDQNSFVFIEEFNSFFDCTGTVLLFRCAIMVLAIPCLVLFFRLMIWVVDKKPH